MAFQRRDHIIQAVAVHVVYGEFRATSTSLGAAPTSECFRMVGPQSIGASRWLFPPAVCVEEVFPAVAVDVAHTQAVTDVHAPRPWLRDRLRDPPACWVGRIRL